MHRRRLLIPASLAAALVAACAVSPEDRASSSAGHDAAAKTHREFARDFENAGDDAPAKYHADKAEQAKQRQVDEECGLLCAIIESLGPEPRAEIPGPGSSCRDPVTTSPAAAPRC